ncbi:hypothetical protein HQ560_04280, partial [bacterium]|nr:hypothetical protein [bacterium]
MKRLALLLLVAATALHAADDAALLDQLDAPLLFAKRFNYLGIHIYDTYYKWRPGGGIYVLENPSAPRDQHKVRPVIDATTANTLGNGIYSEPELSWDATKLLFCYKPTAGGSTSIYEIAIDGSGLRRLSDPTPYCVDYRGGHSGHHDVGPVYLPDGRILFTSTRRNGLVPCANIGVDILHIMDPDGKNGHAISVNNVNEFDPSILPDGRILHGRWEYVDKTALTQQSLWTILPDGTSETALFANNLVRPEALLDPRPVPGSPNLVVASFTPHNAPPRGTIGIVDMHLGKNSPQAIVNLDTPTNPTHDRGNSCDPWPLSKDAILFSGNAKGHKLNAIVLDGPKTNRVLVLADPKIDLHSPMLVKPRTKPAIHSRIAERDEMTGRFFVQDIYQGLTGVKRGDVKWLRVIEETSRTGATHGSGYNQTFLLSAALAFSVKNFLGVVPVDADGSAFFEAPSGRALYLHALDAEGRIVQSMRTFVQAAPGVTRSCIGCHEHKYSTPSNIGDRTAHLREPSQLQPESWGSGFVDFPTMVQPILDKHCVSCHGGEKGFGGGLDLSGGWTEHFNISYENLVSRRETQLTAHLISGIDCMNGTANWSAKIFQPREHGSGNAPLAQALVSGHKDRIPKLSRTERDQILAWIDTNGLYHGTWDRSPHGSRVGAWGATRNALIGQMQAAGCAKCHGDGRKITLFENDWFNLRDPQFSRILRAPLPKGKDGGLGLCRDRKVDPKDVRIRLLAEGRYYHGVLPLEKFPRRKLAPHSAEGEPVVTFASAGDTHYRAMIDIIRKGHDQALAKPRVDMPDAPIEAGDWRRLLPTPLPHTLPGLAVAVDADG